MHRKPVHVLGNVNLDILLGPVDVWPRRGTEVVLPEHELRVGGAAGNVALALGALDIPLHLHASIGRGYLGDVLVAQLGAVGANIPRVDFETAFTVGLAHGDRERTFFSILGHLATFDFESAVEYLMRFPKGYLLVCGYFVMPPLRQGPLCELLRQARMHGHEVLLDTGWPSEDWTPEVRSEVDALLPYVDLALPNEIEALGWSGAHEISEAFAHFEARGSHAVVKLGDRGAVWREAGVVAGEPAVRVQVVDTVGAGDAFNAGLIAALSLGQPLAKAVTVGVHVAGLAISSSPRQYPQRSDVKIG